MNSSGNFAVGLTGGIGCGKTTVADMFAARGAVVIDTDQIAHRLTLPDGAAIPAIRAQFGESFLTSAGAMDRAKMREWVFADPSAKIRLEAILHPLIREEAERCAMQAQGCYLVFVIPLLVESGRADGKSGAWHERLSRILVVDCPESLQVERVMRRSGLTELQVRQIMATQASRAERLAVADDVIMNDTDRDTLLPQVERLHALYCSLSAH